MFPARPMLLVVARAPVVRARRSVSSAGTLAFGARAVAVLAAIGTATFGMAGVGLAAGAPANGAPAQSGSEESLAILPRTIVLRGSKARQAILVERVVQGQFAGQVNEGLSLESSDPKVVRVSKSVAIPVANGTAAIRAAWHGRAAQIDVTVAEHAKDVPWSFRNHVQPVLTKSGCNSGACHGAAAGKNGFKLSLRGYDPGADFQAITRQARGRRIVPSDPGRSLFLTKPSGGVPHKGGLRFAVDSREYRVLAEWIAAGQPAPAPSDPRIKRLEVLPDHAVLARGAQQQLLVRAHFTDGHSEDVTTWARFTSANQTVCQVDDVGKVKVAGNGEGAVVAWYLSKNVVASVSVPFENRIPPETYARAERRNFIDDHVLVKLASLNIPPSPPCSDAEFLRRASLDTIGVLPTADQARAFLSDPSPDKRVRLVESLIVRPEFVDYWTYKWSDLLLVTGARLRPAAVQSFGKWIRERVAHNVPWDRFVRDVVTARGSTLKNGAANFYALHRDPEEMAETVSMAFLGMAINCAHCHDHPLEKWTNDDYYGMANLFARVRGKGWGGDADSGDGDRVIFVADSGDLIQPRTGRPQSPRPLDSKPMPASASIDRRQVLADWLTSPENPYFSRSITNRVWANFMGPGLVEAVDDMRLTNPPSNEPLLKALSEFLVHRNYDLKALMREILTSAAYQRASASVPGNEGDERFYSRFYPRRLKAEVLLDAVSQVTASPTQFKGRPNGVRALELGDADADSYFLTVFGRPERLITCECERSNEPSMSQVLHIANGDTLNAKIEAKGNRIDRLVSAGADDRAIVEDLFLSAFSRRPSPDEERRLLGALAEAEDGARRPALADLHKRIGDALEGKDPVRRKEAFDRIEERLREIPVEAAAARRQAFEDLYWSVLSSKEFLFNR